MGPTACTEPQCLYKGSLYLTFFKREQVSEEAGVLAQYAVSHCSQCIMWAGVVSKDEMVGTYGTVIWWATLKAVGQMEDMRVRESIILQWMLKKYDGKT